MLSCDRSTKQYALLRPINEGICQQDALLRPINEGRCSLATNQRRNTCRRITRKPAAQSRSPGARKRRTARSAAASEPTQCPHRQITFLWHHTPLRALLGGSA
eukprot:163139-Prorocentrum_minimum.AAC.1